MRSPVRVLVVVCLLMLATGAARAQDTGGSIGGGSFSEPSGGGGGGGGGSYDYSSSGGGSSNDYYAGGNNYNGAGCSGGEIAIFVLIALVLGGIKLAGALRSRPMGVVYEGYVPRGPNNSVDVTVLRFGLDARVRPYVQRELDRIAKTADTKSQAGLVTTLHEIALMLRRIRDSWVYGGAHNEEMSAMGDAHATFARHVADVRATFKDELVRAADGKLTTADAPHHVKLTEEGQGLVLVTLVVAARQELFTVSKIADGDDLRRALEVLSALTAQTLVAVEIVWTPADPDDRMSSVELEAKLGNQIFPIRGAMVGKVVCAYCGGPFPKELMTCPHCGAPARDVAPA